ncbi:MAG: hypothetical protein AB8B64_15605 [Granulosicoccus sp.]
MSDAAHTNIREGSSLYYSLLWTDPLAKDRVDQRLALIKALITTLDDVQEPQVAEKKIHWWHEELQRLHEGTARHPATQQNQEALKGLGLAHATCLDLLSAVSTQRFTPFEKTDASNANLTLNFQSRMALLAHALSNETSDLDTSSHPASSALAFAHYEQLARLPNLLHRGLPVFSNEVYTQFQIRPDDLARHIRIAQPCEQEDAAASSSRQSAQSRLKSIPVVSEKAGRRQLLVHAIECNRISLQEALDDQAVTQRYRHAPLLPLWRLLVLRKHQLDLWQKRQPDLLRERITLTPLSKFFRAWQNRR